MTMEPDVFLEPWRTPAVFYHDEDICSLVARMAAMGAMSVRDFVVRYLGQKELDPAHLPFNLTAVTRLAILSGNPLEDLLANAIGGTSEAPGDIRHRGLFRGVKMHQAWIGTQKRIAPGKLLADGDDPYVRLAWRFPALPCDIETGEMLVTRCPRCVEQLRWEATEVAFCHSCRFDLRQARQAYADGETLQATRTLAGPLGLGEKALAGQPLDLPPPFGDLTLEQQVKVLGWCAQLDGMLRRTGTSSSFLNAVVGLRVAQQWPQAMSELVILTARQSWETDEKALLVLPHLVKTLQVGELKKSILPQAIELMRLAIKDRGKPPSTGRPAQYVDI
ncbi:hypothetical protein [Devosia faecipullorum]|uniref:hypothetical protein n=1 Tax=Devosia faecipullorum TaxID=2755039 RepID=UPI00187B7120|nr:hypothetical protein [Devosia faecipullorum]MBE7731669.1 hypothetical protein [Devosia faecipullorum]